MMLERVGKVNEREVYYFNTLNGSDWEFPKNWILFIITSDSNIKSIMEFAKLCLDNNVLYVCCAGDAASIAEDIFDEEFVWRKILAGDDEYSDVLMTTFHKDFSEGLWFATSVAVHESQVIENIVCADFSASNNKKLIIDLIKKINAGWLPDD